jgi:hypothetical protein
MKVIQIPFVQLEIEVLIMHICSLSFFFKRNQQMHINQLCAFVDYYNYIKTKFKLFALIS